MDARVGPERGPRTPGPVDAAGVVAAAPGRAERTPALRMLPPAPKQERKHPVETQGTRAPRRTRVTRVTRALATPVPVRPEPRCPTAASRLLLAERVAHCVRTRAPRTRSSSAMRV